GRSRELHAFAGILGGGTEDPRQLHLPRSGRYAAGAQGTRAGGETRDQELDAGKNNSARGDRGRSGEPGARRFAVWLRAGGAADRETDRGSASSAGIAEIAQAGRLLFTSPLLHESCSFRAQAAEDVRWTGICASSERSSRSARQRSQACCIRSHNPGPLPQNRPSRAAISGATDTFSAIIR